MREGLIRVNISNFLNLSRWVAAFFVVLCYVQAKFFPAINHIKSPDFLCKIAYFFTSLGPQAVIIFFVMSGYLVGGDVLDLYKKGTFNWGVYLTRRMVRLYIVLIPALFITSIGDHLGYHFFNGSSVYNRYFVGGLFSKDSVHVLISNLLMLQLSHGPLFGSNDPLWSLTNEFWYYLLFPLIVGIIFNRSNLFQLAADLKAWLINN